MRMNIYREPIRLPFRLEYFSIDGRWRVKSCFATRPAAEAKLEKLCPGDRGKKFFKITEAGAPIFR